MTDTKTKMAWSLLVGMGGFVGTVRLAQAFPTNKEAEGIWWVPPLAALLGMVVLGGFAAWGYYMREEVDK